MRYARNDVQLRDSTLVFFRRYCHSSEKRKSRRSDSGRFSLTSPLDPKVVKLRARTVDPTCSKPLVRNDVIICVATRLLSSPEPHWERIVLNLPHTWQWTGKSVNFALRNGKSTRIVRSDVKRRTTTRANDPFSDIAYLPRLKPR